MTPDPSDSERSPTADAVRISRRGSAARGRFLARPGRVAVSVLVAGLAVTAAATLTASALDHDNEHRLLEVQTRQAGAVLASTILSIESPLETALRIESATGGDTQEFQRYMASVVGPGRLFVSASLWTTDGSTVQPLTTVGRTPPAASATATRAFVLRAFHRAGFAVTGVPKGRPQDVDYAIADARTTHFVVSAVRAIPADIGLEVAETRSGIAQVRDGFEFLGFTFHGRLLRPRTRALTRFKDEVRRRTRRLAPVPLHQVIEDLDPTIRGWGNDCLIGDVQSLFDELDTWIRMRLRSTVIRRHATHLSNVKMPNRVLVGVGLVSLGALRRTTRSPV